MMQDFTNYRPFINPFAINPVKVETVQDGDEYKVVVDLKPFNGNEKNIKVDVSPNRVSLSGDSEACCKGSHKEVSFSQTFSLPNRVDVTKVTKKKHGNKFVITLPIED